MSGRLQSTKAPGLGGGDEVGWMLFGSYRNLPTVRPYVNDNPLYPAKTAPSYIYTNFAVTTLSKNGEDIRQERAAQINLNADYKFTDWLSLKLIGGYAYQNSSRVKQVKTFDLYDYDKATGEYYVIDGERNPSLYKSYGNTEDYTGQFTFDFHKQFDRHNVALTLGGEASHHISPGLDFTSQPQTDLTTQTNTATLQAINDYLETPQSRAGFIGRFTYGPLRRFVEIPADEPLGILPFGIGRMAHHRGIVVVGADETLVLEPETESLLRRSGR